MTAPQRYLDRQTDELCTRLLRSALDDDMPRASLQRALAAAATASAVVSAAGGAAAATGAGASALGGATLTAIAKWTAAGMLAGLVSAGAASFVTTGGRDAAPPALSGSARVTPIAPDTPAAPLDRAPEPQPAQAPASEAASDSKPTAVRAAPRVSSRTPPAARGSAEHAANTDEVAPENLSPADLLRRELSLIDEARHAIARGHAEDGLHSLDRYRRRYPRGRFAPEATALRVEALLKLGRRAEAKTLSDELQRSAPGSPAAARARRLFESPP